MTSPDRDVALICPTDVGPAGVWAREMLKASLTAHDWHVVDNARRRLAVVWGDSEPESFTIERRNAHELMVRAADERGVVYALTGIADDVANASAKKDPFANVATPHERPTLAWRSVQVFCGHSLLDAEWYFDDAYWQWYLGMLARCRFNNLSLTFGHQTAYLTPPYPFHVPLPEYPHVVTPGFGAMERERHLAQLRRISELAQQRGLHFTLGIWQQHDNGYGKPMVEGLNEDIRAECNALGLQRLLEACPAIDGLQLRMNYEAGVPEDQQSSYWQKQFDAIARVGRSIRVDLRAKGLGNKTIAAAQKQLERMVVSTKHWCEHLGMPYHMAAIQAFDVPHYRRYGTWDLLRKPRTFPLVMRLWSFGTQRVLQWGDASYVRRFMESCGEVGEGFEVMAPLTNKGSRNEPVDQPWRIINDRAIQPFAWEQQRYERFYRLFGRIGYNTESGNETVRRWMVAHHGDAGSVLDRAFDTAGMILPLITTVMQHSASAWGYWPEMFAGRSFIEDARIEPSDPVQFYGIQSYVTDALGDGIDGRWTPHQTAHHLHALAAATRSHLETLDTTSPMVCGAALDLHIQADLAQYHAHRLVAMTHWQVYEFTRWSARLERAIHEMQQAVACWRRLAERADGVYHDHLTFGLTQFGHGGHWKDRFAHAETELSELVKRREQGPLMTDADRSLPGEGLYPDIGGITVDLPREMQAGKPLTAAIQTDGTAEIASAICHHKSALQTLPFRRIAMHRERDKFTATLPAEDVTAAWDVMIFFELHLHDGAALRWPDWRRQTPYCMIRTR